MKRGSIAIDLDDVLAAHVESFVAFSNANYGTNLGVEDYRDHWANLWGVENEEIERRAAKLFLLLRSKRKLKWPYRNLVMVMICI